MPYNSRRYKRRNLRRRRNYYSSNRAVVKSGSSNTMGTIGKIARTALKIGKFVASVINPEYKWWDYSATLPAINANPAGTNTAICMSLINQGVGSQNRIGQSVLLKSINFKFTLNINPAVGAGGTTHCRVIVFQDTKVSQVNSLTYSNVLQTDTNYLSPYSMNNPDRFRTLFDKYIDLGFSNETRTVKFNYHFGEQDKGFDHLKWDITGDLESDIRENHIYLLVLSDQNTNTPQAIVYNRIRFIDN